MTFTDIKTAVKDLCNLTSTEADTRVGKSINRHYRRVTSSLSLDATRFVTRSQSTTNGVRTVTFTSIEKIDRVIDATDSNAIRKLIETSVDALRTEQPGTGQPTRYAIQSVAGTSVTILIDTLPQVTYSLQADGKATLSDLTGTDVPAIPESYHDILTFSVVAEELLKKEKVALAREYASGDENRPGRAEKLLEALRFQLADSHSYSIRQGDRSSTTGSAAGGSGSGSVGGTAYTQTALLTFDRGAGLAPFAVAQATALVVTNLDADKLDGQHAPTGTIVGTSDTQTLTNKTLTAPIIATISNTGTLTLPTSTDTLVGRATTDTLTNKTLTSPSMTTPTVTSGVTTLATDIVFSADSSIRRNTADGSDSGSVGIAGGGGAGTQTRGSGVICYGNEAAVQGGRLELFTGNVAGSYYRFLTNAGGVALQVDGADGLVTLSQGQLAFPASQNASSNANTLDDYEEGTWTPSDQSGAGLTFTSVTAQYIKIGQLVVAAVTLTYPTTADGSQMNIGGLPFTAQSTAENIYGAIINFSNESTLAYIHNVLNTTRVLGYISDGSAISNATMSTNTVRFTSIYRATA